MRVCVVVSKSWSESRSLERKGAPSGLKAAPVR
jgi:hypothetical protein